jgi:hypothetical protein
MRHGVLRRLVLCLSLLTLVGDGWSSVTAQAAARPCTMAMEMGGTDAASLMGEPSDQSVPCPEDKGGVLVCAKRICCLATVMLPVPPPPPVSLLGSAVRYLPAMPLHGGRSVEPDLLPPITA